MAWVIEENEAVLYGIPGPEHNCDEMGCPSVGHVLKVVSLLGDDTVMESALDRIWRRMYPDKSEWIYPAQVSLHVTAVLSEYEEKLKELRELVVKLKTELNQKKETI